jgi:hypothetical protein
MTVREIGKQRPNAKPSNVGLEETVAGVVLHYFAERDVGSEKPPQPSDRITQIEAVWTITSDDSAAEQWARSAAQLNQVLGSLPDCFRTSPAPVAFARWRTRSGALAYLRQQHSFIGVSRVPTGFMMGFSVDTTVLRPALTGASRTSCEHPFGPEVTAR